MSYAIIHRFGKLKLTTNMIIHCFQILTVNLTLKDLVLKLCDAQQQNDQDTKKRGHLNEIRALIDRLKV
jgi:hypothetical protein